MAKLIQSLVYILFAILLCASESTSCKYDPSECVCRNEENEIELNLKYLTTEITKVQIGKIYSFDFAFCHSNIKCGGKDSSLCFHNNGTDISLGTINSANVIKSMTNVSAYDIYFNESKTVISLICSAHLHKSVLAFANTTNPNYSQSLMLFSMHACEVPPHPGLSTGSKFLLIFFLFFWLYFTLGAIVLYFIRGARGWEIIPNIDFWRGLSSLVKDGALFLLNGCNPVTVPSAEAYDRI